MPASFPCLAFAPLCTGHLQAGGKSLLRERRDALHMWISVHSASCGKTSLHCISLIAHIYLSELPEQEIPIL